MEERLSARERHGNHLSSMTLKTAEWTMSNVNALAQWLYLEQESLH